MIRLGYVGQNTLLPTASKTFRIANYTEERMLELALSNLLSLENILRWNLANNISLFRITSHLIPYASSEINSGIWKNDLQKEFLRIGRFIKGNKMKVSMHPGQYTVLNTPSHTFYENSLRDLEYHNEIFELMGLDSSHKIIVHGGGGYGNKTDSTKVLLERLNRMPLSIRSRLTLENDETTFNAEDIYNICTKTRLPGVLDVFHHLVNPSFFDLDLQQIILKFGQTWVQNRQKIHYSNQEPNKMKGAHSQTINLIEFAKFYNKIKDFDLDIMLEVKDKQNSVLKLREKFPELR